YATTRMPGTIMENVILGPDGTPDFTDDALTANTRAAYPIEYIENLEPSGTAGHPQNIVFLTCDAFGVLPPIARLTPEQAAYHFISGYTAKVAGTEMNIDTPTATFSACFGAPFMPRHPGIYAKLLTEKITRHQSQCWLLNTGWIAGGYGQSDRIKIKWTRALINAALKGQLAGVDYKTDPRFGFQIPQTCPNVPPEILTPRNTWPDPAAYDHQANQLAEMFRENFQQYAENTPAPIRNAGPTEVSSTSTR
ncbi:MAG: phosphoenolpyruvate carboxykinase (ATP), partial [Verrucomicrobiota bacterium]|nr:phosphoenolpyruvate carboxykinase (ATP) [Verrucomicrobiota bacterium]